MGDNYIFLLPKSGKFLISKNAWPEREKLVPELALGVLGNGELSSEELEHEIPGFCALLCVWIHLEIQSFLRHRISTTQELYFPYWVPTTGGFVGIVVKRSCSSAFQSAELGEDLSRTLKNTLLLIQGLSPESCRWDVLPCHGTPASWSTIPGQLSRNRQQGSGSSCCLPGEGSCRIFH